jgi:hypothetical protein
VPILSPIKEVDTGANAWTYLTIAMAGRWSVAGQPVDLTQGDTSDIDFIAPIAALPHRLA